MTEETKRKSETIERIATKLSILAILGGAIAAINHYAGYSFLKGVIEVIGLGNSNVELSNQETTHMTMFAIRTMHENWMDEVAKFFKMGWESISVLCLIVALYWYLFFEHKLSKKNKNKPSRVFNWLKKIPGGLKKLFAYPFFAFIGLIIYMISISTLLWVVWGILSIFFSAGQSYGAKLIGDGVCRPFKEVKKEEYSKVSGCTVYIDAYGNYLQGRIVYTGKKEFIFVTNTESVIFDEKGKHLACSPRYDLDKSADKQLKHHCSAPLAILTKSDK